ncbi:MAG: hypothetical protein Q8J78_07220, partial [Moraxellaceae bacterium]|nr:hypothetical protein [Moraxellaceae bacterium]
FTSTLGSINPTSGTALTDAAGYAKVNLTAGSIGGAGIATVTFGTAKATKGFVTDGSGGNSVQGTLTSLGLFNASGAGSAITVVTSSVDGFYRVQVRDANGNGVPNQIISFTTDIGVLVPSNGKVVTSASGVAEITVKAGDSDGAGTLRATTSLGATTLSTSQVFTARQDVVEIGRGVGGAFVKGSLLLSTNSLPTGSTATVTANIVNETAGNTAFNTPVSVTFTSNCAAVTPPKAVIDTTVISQSGVAIATYRPQTGCTNDVITATATLNNSAKAAQASLTILEAAPSSVNFLSAAPRTIAIKGTGGAGRSESADVEFEVRDETGSAVSAGVSVSFSLTTQIGGLSFSNGTPNFSAVTDGAGKVKATVLAGTVPTPVRVVARLTGAGVQPEAVSDVLSVSTGLPTQNAFSVAVSVHNPSPAAGSYDGTVVTVTGRGADHFNNPVPDGTVIQFISEAGAIGPQCTTTNGACSVQWVSGGARSAGYDPDRITRLVSPLTPVERDLHGLLVLRQGIHDRFGRSTILAYAIGEESFSDANTNNRHDAGEGFVDMPEAFLDNNETGLRETPDARLTERFVDFDNSGAYSPKSGSYNGSLCSTAPACSLTNVRRSNLIIQATESVQVYVFAGSRFVNLDGAAWVDNSSDDTEMLAPSRWGNTVLRGSKYENTEYVDPDTGNPDTTKPTAPFAEISPTGQAVSIKYNQLGVASFTVLVADMNGNAPQTGTTVTVDPGSATKMVGRASCTVASATEPVPCSFAVTTPDSPATAFPPIAITITSGSISVGRSILLDTSP